MRGYGLWLGTLAAIAAIATAGAAEFNPVRERPVSIGPEASRIIVGFRATAGNALVQTVKSRMQAQSVRIVQARTTPQDVAALAQRAGVATAGSRQLTPSMHVLFLPQTLYGASVAATLAKLRADPAVLFADVDQRRYPSAANPPNDPLYAASGTSVCSPPDCSPAQTYSNGQWFMRTPPATAGLTNNDFAATDAVSAWGITTGSTGVVIADVDTGVRYDHPDLLRAGFNGRLLPGYDFVDQDYNPNSPYNALGTFLIANDGDGWDPDPSDPGDWISVSDLKNPLFPPANCGDPSNTDQHADSSWHGTRVAGLTAALTNNGVGIAGMSWGPWFLPVRALGKCGGYDSDIITAIEWAAGVPGATLGTGLPDNPYPANIINLSLGGTGACPSSYQAALQMVTQLGVLVVASAGNGGTPGQPAAVDAPANCSVLVPGVLAVAGLRNVGTKVGYSSFGPEVSLSAPAGNCVQSSGACLRSIDTTTNDGLTIAGTNTYSDQINPNLGTSFSSPIVASIAALMRSVNANLTPAELSSRLETSASPFPANSAGLLVCPANDATTGECACPPSGQCGTGMVNALSAVNSALRPIAAVALPTAGSTFDASGSAPACGRTISSYAWSASGGATISGATNGPTVVAMGGASGGTLTLTLTDSANATDMAVVNFASNGTASTTAPSSAGTAMSACPAALTFAPVAPTVTDTLSPASVGQNVNSTLTITLHNANPFDLTQGAFNFTLPNNLTIAATPQTTTSCPGTGLDKSASYTTTTATLVDAIIPANGSCSIVIPVVSTMAASYVVAVAVNDLMTGPAGGNTAAASATLTVTAPSSGRSGGGGALGWPELAALAALAWAAGRRAWREAR